MTNSSDFSDIRKKKLLYFSKILHKKFDIFLLIVDTFLLHINCWHP